MLWKKMITLQKRGQREETDEEVFNSIRYKEVPIATRNMNY